MKRSPSRNRLASRLPQASLRSDSRTGPAASDGKPLDIAIVGLSGCFAGAPNAPAFWKNILDKVDAVAEAGPEWTGPYFEANTTANDRTYTTKGGFLRGLAEVNPAEFGVLPSLLDGGDPDHLLALKYARDALVDAGYLGAGRVFEPERAGVVIGRGTYGNRAMAGLIARGLFLDQAMDIARALRPDLSSADLDDLRQHFRGQLPAYNADMVGVTTPNVIAGLIANRLNLMGPNYIVDAACASALFALDAAVRELVAGHCDLMVTGAVQSHTPPQLYIQFSQIRALSHDKIRPFQRGADGILLGEGVGMLVLKRLADAKRDGDRIYAVIKGVGLASDGKAKGLLAPRAEGQLLALRHAYERSGIDPLSVDLIEAHGTGTEVGDRTEIEVLRKVFGERGAAPQIALGSVKSMIGHCLPAAGIASLIKTALALHHKVLPPTLCDEPNPDLLGDGQPFYINNETRPWIHGGGHPRRAGINAFGFGGANAHVILEEYRGTTADFARTLSSARRAEMVTLAADSAEGLIRLGEAALAHLRGPSPTRLADVAKASAGHAQGTQRLAIVADSPESMAEKLEQSLEVLRAPPTMKLRIPQDAFLGSGAPTGKVCFMFPGEGVFPGKASAYPEMLSELCLHYPQVRQCFDRLEQSALREGKSSSAAELFPSPTRVDDGQREERATYLGGSAAPLEYGFTASLALLRLLQAAGLSPDAMLGYGAGDFSARVASAGSSGQSLDEAIHWARQIGEAIRSFDSAGEGVHVFADALWPETREALLERIGRQDSGLHLVADNCPNQMTVFGAPAAARELKEWLDQQGSITTLVPAQPPLHTPRCATLVKQLQRKLEAWRPVEGSIPVYGASTAKALPQDSAGFRKQFCAQWQRPLRFAETLRQLYDEGFRVFVEVGPSGMLCPFVRDTLFDRGDVTVFACDRRIHSSVLQFHLALAQLFAAGLPVDMAGLHAHRDGVAIDLLSPPLAPRRSGIPLSMKMPALTVPPGWRPMPVLPR